MRYYKTLQLPGYAVNCWFDSESDPFLTQDATVKVPADKATTREDVNGVSKKHAILLFNQSVKLLPSTIGAVTCNLQQRKCAQIQQWPCKSRGYEWDEEEEDEEEEYSGYDWVDGIGSTVARSNVDHTRLISKSIFVTNFPDNTTSKDLWEVCKGYGTVVDVFIPDRKSKAGKRFAFVRFIKVDNVDRLVGNLCTLWIGRMHLHANVARFDRPPIHSSRPNISTRPAANGASSFASVLKGNPNNFNHIASSPAMVLDDECVVERDLDNFVMGEVKDFSSINNLRVLLSNEGFQHGSMIVWIDLEGRSTIQALVCDPTFSKIWVSLGVRLSFDGVCADTRFCVNVVSLGHDTYSLICHPTEENSSDPFKPSIDLNLRVNGLMANSVWILSIPFPPGFKPDERLPSWLMHRRVQGLSVFRESLLRMFYILAPQSNPLASVRYGATFRPLSAVRALDTGFRQARMPHGGIYS
ncbi:RNA-directed DNA polymerase, eukaryota, nucleotide-binding alpha-beta plait domain protein [Tanacetum coccineum]